MFHFISSFIFFFIAAILYLSAVPGIVELGLAFPVAVYLIWGLSSGTVRHLWGGVAIGWLIDAYSPHFFGVHAILFLSLASLMYLLKRYFMRRYFWGELMMITSGLIFSALLFSFLIGFRNYHVVRSRVSWGYLGEEIFLISILVAFSYGLLSLWFRKEAIESEPYLKR